MRFLDRWQCLTDLLFSLCATPVFVRTLATEAWHGGRLTCEFSGFAIHSTGCATILSLAIITHSRWRAIVPLSRRNKRLKPLPFRALNRAYACVWAFSLAYGALPFLGASVGRYVFHPSGLVCFGEATASPFMVATPVDVSQSTFTH